MSELDGRAKGGVKRAEALSPERRREIAMKGVAAKRERAAERQELSKLSAATHQGVLAIGDKEIPCFVLEDRTRVLSQAQFLEALGRHRKANVRDEGGEERLPAILQGKAINPYISQEVIEKSRPVLFRTMDGVRASGYRAELLPDVCEIYLKARDEKKLPANQAHVAMAAELLVRGLARVGIIALVDEATGFQYDRPRRDLEEQLKKYISDSLRKWVRTFPADYFRHLCRLRGVELRADMRLPQYFGHLTNNLVYRRLAPGLVRRLKEKRIELKGEKSHNLHSLLSADVGFPEVLVHLGTVIGIMKAHTNYDAFEKQLNDIAPIYPEVPGLFDDPKDWEPR